MGSTPDLGFETLWWEDDHLVLLDQTQLPDWHLPLPLREVPELVHAIQALSVRGAPALGCAGAYGMVLAVQGAQDLGQWQRSLDRGAAALKASRPTAVNLAVGVDRMWRLGHRLCAAQAAEVADLNAKLLQAARAFHREDAAFCLTLAEHALPLLRDGARVLTHCNAGALATGGLGTALAPLHLAHHRGLRLKVYADETRPLRQGVRLTAWELATHGVEVDVLPDSAAGSLLASGEVDLILVGSDRIAANGDVANKIGTYPLAVLAERHQVPFHVLAPSTTIDPSCPDGDSIPIEHRAMEEVTAPHSLPQGVGAYNPAFDVTPAELVHTLISEHGRYCAHGEGAQAWQAYVQTLAADRPR